MSLRRRSAKPRDLKPALAMDAEDFGKLARLSSAIGESMPDLADYLARELERAHVVPPGSLRDDVVRMGSAVRFRDLQTGREQDVVLVFPPDADIERRRISVLTPIGAALIGLSKGQTISFHTRNGERRELTVLDVSQP